MNFNSHDANNSIKKIAEQLRELSTKVTPHFETEVYSVIHNDEKDEQRIENLLDELLNYCYDEKVLILFKKFCAYYYNLNPQAAAEYVNFYRQMWDCESIHSPSGRGLGLGLG